MKKLFTLLTIAVCFTTSVNAQRMLDMSSHMTSLTPNKVGLNEDFTMNCYYQNAGSVATKATDTIIYAWAYGASYISINGNVWFFKTTQKVLNAGDTAHVKNTLHWTNYPEAPADSTKNMCFVVDILNRSADSSKDNNTANNVTGCQPLTRKAIFPANILPEEILDFSEVNKVNLYPNPAKNEAFFGIQLNSNTDVSIRIFDVTGRVVIEENHGKLEKGTKVIRVSTENLINGYYQYQVVMGSQTESGRLSIIK